jgi:hypothetical protein
VGVVDIEQSYYLILVANSELVFQLSNLTVSKINEIHFHELKKQILQEDDRTKLKMKEEKNRLKRLLTKYGYYSRGASLSNTVIEMSKDISAVPEEQGLNRDLVKGLAGFLSPTSLDRYRRKEYSANYPLVNCIESTMKKQLWIFDIVIVGRFHLGICR